MTLGRVRNPADDMLVILEESNVRLNLSNIRGPETVAYSGLLLKMQCGDPTISRATHYIGAYELKLQRNNTLAETNTQTPFENTPELTIQKTTLTMDETESSASEVRETPINKILIESTHTGGVDTLKDFLSKPTILATGTLQTSDVANSWLSTWVLPQALFASAKQLTKLKGILMFRADIEITFKVNATRFQQGRYLLRWVYFAGGRNMAGGEKLAGAHIANLTATTSANCTSIDLATQTTVSFVIPYASVSNYSLVDQTDTQRGPICRLYLIPYDPLQAGSGVNTAQYTLYARLMNITTSGNVVLQSQKLIRVEQDAGGVGPISGTLTKVSKTTSLFGSVPLLSPYLSSVGWLADTAASAAKIWGYSKPITLDPPKTIVRRMQPSMANSDQVFAGHKISNLVVAEVPKNTGRARCDVDEMAFQYIAGHFAWIKTVTWSNTQTSSTLLSTIPVGIGMDNTAIGKGHVWPPCDYIAQVFAAYRGGVKYRLTIPKTEFHSGRLCVAFVPWDSNSAVVAPANVGETDNLYRVFWDVRESNTLELDIPYVSMRNFTNVGRNFGYLYIYVLNELMAPSTVPSSVNILIEKAAMDDIEYAGPFRGFYTQSSWPEPYIQFQSGSVKLGQSGVAADIFPIESFGERVVSLRALLKRFSTFLVKNDATTTSIDIYPFEIYPTVQTGSLAGPLVRNVPISDMINYFQPLFAMSSGGMRFTATVDKYTGSSNWGLYGVVSTPTDVVAYGSTNFVVPQSPVQAIGHGVEGTVSIEVPQYTLFGQRCISSMVCSSSADYSPTPNYLEGGSFYLLRCSFPVVIDMNANRVAIHRAIADDYSLSLFNGVIPTVFSNVV